MPIDQWCKAFESFMGDRRIAFASTQENILEGLDMLFNNFIFKAVHSLVDISHLNTVQDDNILDGATGLVVYHF